MNLTTKKIALTAASLLLMLGAGSCNDINKQESPVTLVVTNDQILHQIDLAGDPTGATKCQQSIATVHMRSIVLQSPTQTGVTQADLNQIKIDRYQVSYVRTDGGHLVPSPFVRSTSVLINAGGSQDASGFQAFDPGALNSQPFAALLPQNGGRDPETGKTFISMDLVLTVFGQTLAGERVAGSTRVSLNFCFVCSTPGCQ